MVLQIALIPQARDWIERAPLGEQLMRLFELLAGLSGARVSARALSWIGSNGLEMKSLAPKDIA